MQMPNLFKKNFTDSKKEYCCFKWSTEATFITFQKLIKYSSLNIFVSKQQNLHYSYSILHL